MGKIRVKTLGDDEAEKEQKKKALRQAEGKAQKEAKKAEVKAEKIVEVVEEKKTTKAKKEKFAKNKKSTRSKSYQAALSQVDRTKTYTLSDAIALLPKLKRATFDETIELHINTLETGLSGAITLPHGAGKKTRVAIADDTVIANVEKGIVDFDVLLATPQMMPKLAKVAKVLGPRGLMPNPKNGTVTAKPEEVAKQYEGGQIRFKTEAKSPIIHVIVGKMSYGDKKLTENIETFLAAIPSGKIKNATLKSTMSPGVKISL